MEDSFKVRVDRLFSSLSSSSSSSSSTTVAAAAASSFSSLWSLTDDEVERKERNRDKGSPEPEFDLGQRGGGRGSGGLRPRRSRGDFRDELERYLKDLDDEDDMPDQEEEPRSWCLASQFDKLDDYNDEEWEIKSSIGRDCTLDYEV